MLVANKTFTQMDSPNLMIVEVTESPKEGSKAGMKQDEQHQQDQQEKKEGLKAAEKSVVSSTKPELKKVAQMQMETERMSLIADSNSSACFGCKMPFASNSELVLMSPDLKWHHNCCTCSACGTNLSDSKQCHLRDGKPYCTEDYVRQFGVPCEGCQQWINNGDALVHNINGKTFHASCLCCNRCNKKLKTGDSFVFSKEDNALLCLSDCQYWMQPGPSPSSAPGMFTMPPAVYAPPPAMGIPEEQTLSVIQKRAGVNSRSSRQRHRERTAYDDRQKSKLMSYYKKNPRPTTQEKEAYAEEIGVPKERVNIWFQNRRCMDKKKQEIEERLKIAQQQDQRREAQTHQQPSFLPADLAAHLPPKDNTESENHPQLGAGPLEEFLLHMVDMPWAPVPPATSIPPTHAMLPAHQHHYFRPPAISPMLPAKGFLSPLAHTPSPHPSHQSYSPNEYSHRHNSLTEASSLISPYMVCSTDPQAQQHHSQTPRNTYTLTPVMYQYIQHTNSASLALPPHSTAYTDMDLMQQTHYTFHLTHDGHY